MAFTTPETVEYYTTLVKTQRRDRFLAAMFLPPETREKLIAIYALDIELEHVHHVVKEEMMGHIRYAWWQERLEALQQAADHPVLVALASINPSLELLLPIVTAYRENFPELPPNTDTLVTYAARHYAGSNKKWEKATAIISRHRKKHGKKYDGLLLIKLLFV